MTTFVKLTAIRENGKEEPVSIAISTIRRFFNNQVIYFNYHGKWSTHENIDRMEVKETHDEIATLIELASNR